MKCWSICSSLLFATAATGCTSSPQGAVGEPSSSIRSLCEAGHYHEAMRQLPKEMDAWAEYT
ncbi:MAG: hypothetical protein AAF581_21610, partial [Planctomycetota bacterium]